MSEIFLCTKRILCHEGLINLTARYFLNSLLNSGRPKLYQPQLSYNGHETRIQEKVTYAVRRMCCLIGFLMFRCHKSFVLVSMDRASLKRYAYIFHPSNIFHSCNTAFSCLYFQYGDICYRSKMALGPTQGPCLDSGASLHKTLNKIRHSNLLGLIFIFVYDYFAWPALDVTGQALLFSIQ